MEKAVMKVIWGLMNMFAELAHKHKEFSGEIYGMIKKEYSEWESRWNEIM